MLVVIQMLVRRSDREFVRLLCIPHFSSLHISFPLLLLSFYLPIFSWVGLTVPAVTACEYCN